MSTGAVLFERDDWKSQINHCSPATLWLLGPEAQLVFDGLPESDYIRENRIFPDGGYCFLPIVNSELGAELIFDFGPLGLWPNAAHGHADALNIMVRVNGYPLLTDPGTGTYFGSKDIRNELRNTSSHNTITVDGFGQADMLDTFKWINPFRIHEVEIIDEGDFAYIAAAHNGFRRLRSPVTHHRSILAIPGRAWIVVDRLTGLDRHTVNQHFHLEPDVQLQRESETHFRVINDKAQGGIDCFFLRSNLETDSLHVSEDSLWSGAYGRWRSSTKIERSVKAQLPISLVTIIKPIQLSDCKENTTVFETIDTGADDIWLWKAKTDSGSEIVLVNPRRSIVTSGEFSSGSKLVYLQLDPDEEIVTAAAFGSGVTKYADFSLGDVSQRKFASYRRGSSG